MSYEPSRLLARLIELRLVEQLVPVTEHPERTRRRIYRIADNYLAFWLGRVERYRSQVERGLGKPVARLLESELDDAMGAPWEAAFRSHLVRLVTMEEFRGDIVALGPWWNGRSAVEIDAVGLAGRARTPVLFGEAKWAQSVDAGALARSLERKADNVPGVTENRTYVVAARTHVREAPEGVVPITAADIFAV